MKKKVLAFALAVCMAFGSASMLPQGTFVGSTAITASAASYNGFEYTVTGDTVCINSYKGTAKNVVIPAKIDGKTVDDLDGKIFKGNTTVQSVKFEADIKILPAEIFSGCTALKSVELPPSMYFFYYSGFQGCTSLESIKIPDKVKEIPSSFFSGCTNLATIELPSGLEEVQGGAFAGTKWLAQQQKKDPLVVYNSILIDGTKYAKADLTIPENITSISSSAFEGNTSIVKVSVPNTVKQMGSSVFEDCTSLKSADIAGSIKELQGTFRKCSSLESVTLHEGTKVLQNFTFYKCTKLKSISLPASMETIGYGAFESCEALTELIIPKGVKELGSYAFSGCTGLKELWLPEGLEEIGSYCFCYDTGLKSLFIPKSVTYIGNKAFGYESSSSSAGLIEGVKILCYKGSAAEKYAADNGIKCELVTKCPHVYMTVVVQPTCTEQGYTQQVCLICGEGKAKTNLVKATGHSFRSWSQTKQATVVSEGAMTRSCKVCDEVETKAVATLTRDRVYGKDRYQTAFEIADKLKEAFGTDGFENIVIASGTDFADALSAAYLARVRRAPILITSQADSVMDAVAQYVQKNAKSYATVYIVGGEGAVSAKMESKLKGFKTQRLAGKNRYLTNLEVLKEAGVDYRELLVASGLEYADALSASATGRPILLVAGKSLTAEQKAFLDSALCTSAAVVGGSGAVSTQIEQQVRSYIKSTTRIGGANRYETSAIVANRYFGNPKAITVAYGFNYPDGLCGGPLAAAYDSPLILAVDKATSAAAAYTKQKGVKAALAFGGPTLVSDEAVSKMLG